MVDTNVLLYAYDRGEPEKQPQAFSVLDRLTAHDLGVLSSQVLAEFFVNSTRKLQPPLTAEEAYDRIQNYLLAWEIIDVTGPIVLEAARGVRAHNMPYWDAQIWATARMNQIPVIFSEDFGSGTVIEGIRIVNPFASDFQLDTWVAEPTG
jgi:predicted nucleic acid-binding protein